MRRRATILIALLGAVAFGLLVLRQMVGPIGFGFAGRGPVGELRLLAGLSAAVIGASLAISGTLLQATLRNPLASPWVLGLTSGASLGVVLVIVVGGGGTGLEETPDLEEGKSKDRLHGKIRQKRGKRQ